MQDGNGKRSGTRARALASRLAFPAGAVAIAGVVCALAVTPLVAAGLVAMPTYMQASATGTDFVQPIEARAEFAAPDRSGPETAERRDRVFAAPQEVASVEPARPDFADFDPQRFSTATVIENPSPATGEYAWISSEAASVTLASLDRRFAMTAASDALDVISPSLPAAEETQDAATGIPVPEFRPGGSAVAAVQEPAVQEPEVEEPARQAVTPVEPEPQRGTALAYAKPDTEVEEKKSGGIFGRLFNRRDLSMLPGRGSKVAVYDIGAATLYMPNGDQLEAHSGLAHMKDNPRYVAEKNKGPTPPNLYNLKMRESLFHGVEAVRLLPADGKKKYNRDGLLAHTYMHVRGGGLDDSQSNGCMAVKEYDKFLNAFKRGQIKHLIVVPHLREVPTYMAAL